VGRLDLEVLDGRVANWSGRLILLGPNVKEDEEIKSIIDEHKKLMDDSLKEVIAGPKYFLTEPGGISDQGKILIWADSSLTIWPPIRALMQL